MIRICADVDILAARNALRALALDIGAPPRTVLELSIVVSELAWNVLKHGGGGHMVLESIDDLERGIGLRIVAFDEGPPIRDLVSALRDGFDDCGPIDPSTLLRRGGLGGGLGAVARFTDALSYVQHDGHKRIEAVRYLRRPSSRPRPDARKAS
jgi:serine/threonine-protein kinase RsbT